MRPEDIAEGVPVFHTSNPGNLGILTGNRMDALFPMAEVDWGSHLEFADISKLEPRNKNRSRSTDDEVREGCYGTIDDLHRRITFEKLRGTLTDVFYSMKTSEIDFYPHQFKPVLRFIESATNRLLIADEVGLGKTIEAGLIWTEWQAREKARRLLIVCPPTLVPKWLREMQDRFQFAAEATDAKHLCSLLERFDRSGPGMSFVLVASYHALRPRGQERNLIQKIRDSSPLEELVESGERVPPRVKLLGRMRQQAEESMLAGSHAARFLDMVVFDEAHYMKNTASASYLAGELISSAASASVCLSATPIHNTSRDLYALLRLIDPEVFRDNFGFDQLVEQNLPIVRLQNALAQPNWEEDAIEEAIAQIDNPAALEHLQTLFRSFDGSPRQRVELRHAAERINLLGNFINRTRKRDIIENRVIRQPVTFPLTLTREEQALYKLILVMVRAAAQREGKGVTSFHLLHPALRMSSCLPSIVDDLRAGRWGEPEDVESIEEDFDFESDDEADLPISLGDLEKYDFERNDSKYRALREALRMMSSTVTLKQDGSGDDVFVDAKDKIIVFAFFKKTIAYLKRRLEADGFKVAAVTGDIQDRQERDKILRSFAQDDRRILLCSEIGAEGIDLQFARVVVNYDLPWNPMRVEQRIGRIDRIGQKSPNIVIINFHVRGTIDGNIFAHLYSKIGVFERSIGALEGILGEEVSKLTATILREELSPEQMAERAEQTGDAIEARAKMESELENSTGALVAFQDLLSEQIGESQRLGKFIRPRELRQHAEDFLAANYKGADACIIQPDNPAPDCLQIKMSFRAFSDFESFCQSSEYAWPDGFSRGMRTVSLTFDPAVHQAEKRIRKGVVLVTHLHPFFRWITDANAKTNNNWHKVSAIRLSSDAFPRGRYFYLVYRLTMTGITRRDEFHYALMSMENGTILQGSDAEFIFTLALDQGTSAFPEAVGDHSAVLSELRNALSGELANSQASFRQDQEQKFTLRQQQLLAHFDRRIEAQERRIRTSRARGVDPRKIAGFEKYLENLKGGRNERLAQLQERAAAGSESMAEVACGIMDNHG
jgi:superfamily II DNA or RNA helicase